MKVLQKNSKMWYKLKTFGHNPIFLTFQKQNKLLFCLANSTGENETK